MFVLTCEHMEGPLLDAQISAGGFVTFVGRVRDSSRGLEVKRLEYEAYSELAVCEGEKIIEEAMRKFDIVAAACAHRTGSLDIGEAAIRVDVAAAHRKAAFAACEYIVDEVKSRVPIWKKEHYVSGEAVWIRGPERAHTQDGFYSRQIRLPEVGESGQEKLARSRVLVVGAGGLGCAALQYLAAAGVGTIGICEQDTLYESNLHRQVLYEHRQIGHSKVALAHQRLRALNPNVSVQIHPERLTATNARDLLRGYDMTLDCADNFATKFLLNDIAVSLGLPLFQASIYQYEGQLLAVLPGGPCLRCLWRSRPSEASVGSCADAGVLGVVPGVFGTLQASEAIKSILGLPSPLREGKIVLLDLLTLRSTELAMSRDPLCPACGSGILEKNWTVAWAELSGHILVDVRSAEEIAAEPGDAHICIPVDQLEEAAGGWDPSRSYALLCATGVRSDAAAKALRDAGRKNVFSVAGGLSAL